MPGSEPLPYAGPRTPKHVDWVHRASIAVLSVAVFNHATSPLVLATPGNFVGIHATTAGLCLVALAVARRRVVVLITLLLGFAALVALSRDHDRGMEFARRRGWADAQPVLEPATQPATGPAVPAR